MIWTVTPNPALDITYRVDRLQIGGSHRVQGVTERPGGKGLNVASVLGKLGEAVTVAGFLGGGCGTRIRRLIGDLPGLRQAETCWVEVPAETRRTVAVVDDVGDTIFNEPGHPVAAAHWTDLISQLTDRLTAGDLLACSGSVAPGTEPGQLERLVSAARERGAWVIVDSSGPWLLEAARAGADLLKPNTAELLAATGTTEPADGAQTLLELGAAAVAVSAGADGMTVRLADGAAWSARVPKQSGNSIGAGDAAVAAWCRALTGTAPIGELAAAGLRDACALSAAAVLAPVAGEFDAAAYPRLLDQITLERLP